MAFDAEVVQWLKANSTEELSPSEGVIEYKLDIDTLNKEPQFQHILFTMPMETWRKCRELKLASKQINAIEGQIIVRLVRSSFCIIQWHHPLNGHWNQDYQISIPLVSPSIENILNALRTINDFHYVLSKDEAYQSAVLSYASV